MKVNVVRNLKIANNRISTENSGGVGAIQSVLFENGWDTPQEMLAHGNHTQALTSLHWCFHTSPTGSRRRSTSSFGNVACQFRERQSPPTLKEIEHRHALTKQNATNQDISTAVIKTNLSPAQNSLYHHMRWVRPTVHRKDRSYREEDWTASEHAKNCLKF